MVLVILMMCTSVLRVRVSWTRGTNPGVEEVGPRLVKSKTLKSKDCHPFILFHIV
jgi:hypothetical protein